MGLVAALCYISVFVYITIKDAGSTSSSGSTQKILLNHLQLVSLCVNYPLNWPGEMLSMFSFMSIVSDISDKVLDMDCALKDPSLFWWSDDAPFYLLQIFYACIPFILIAASLVFWAIQGGMLHCCFTACDKKSRFDKGEINLILSDVPEALKAKYEKRREEEHRLMIQHKFLQANAHAKVGGVHSNGEKLSSVENLFAAVNTVHHRQQSAKAKQSRNKITSILKSEFAKASEISGDDKRAIAKMRAREFLRHCKKARIHLTDLWLQYDHDGNGAITYLEFEHILHSLGFKWSQDEVQWVCELFDGDDGGLRKKITRAFTSKKKKNTNSGNNMIELNHLVGYNKSVSDKMVVTCLVIVYIMYPIVTRQVFKLLACRGGFSDGGYRTYLLYDLSQPCGDITHFWYLLFIGLPTLIAVVIGYPVMALCILRKHRKHFGHDTIMFRYGILHAGYADKTYWWEVMISSRKAVLISVSVFTLTFGVDVQAFIGLFVVVCFMAVTIRSEPYENDHLNALENWSLGVAFATLYCGLLFYSGKLSEYQSKVLAWLLISLNAIYVIWIGTSLVSQHIRRYCCNEKNPHLEELIKKSKQNKRGHHDELLNRKSAGIGKKSKIVPKLSLERRKIIAGSFITEVKEASHYGKKIRKNGAFVRLKNAASHATHMDKAQKNIEEGKIHKSRHASRTKTRRQLSGKRLEARLKKRASKVNEQNGAELEAKIRRESHNQNDAGPGSDNANINEEADTHEQGQKHDEEKQSSDGATRSKNVVDED